MSTFQALNFFSGSQGMGEKEFDKALLGLVLGASWVAWMLYSWIR